MNKQEAIDNFRSTCILTGMAIDVVEKWYFGELNNEDTIFKITAIIQGTVDDDDSKNFVAGWVKDNIEPGVDNVLPPASSGSFLTGLANLDSVKESLYEDFEIDEEADEIYDSYVEHAYRRVLNRSLNR